MDVLDLALADAGDYAKRIRALQEHYRSGAIRTHVPPLLLDYSRDLDELAAEYLPLSRGALDSASQSLFSSLPVAFDPAESVGPYLATVDRDASGRPYRFLDLGALIATQCFGENDVELAGAILRNLPCVVGRYAHSEYQTELSLTLKSRLTTIAPPGTPRFFVVNTGAEAVENAMKSVLLNRVRAGGADGGYFIISFDGAFHGRTLGCLAVTQRKKAKVGFPTFDWPHVPFPFDNPNDAEDTRTRELRALRAVWDILVTGRVATSARSRSAFQRELSALDAMLAWPKDRVEEGLRMLRATLDKGALARARKTAAVLLEPIQGEGGVRLARSSFHQRLRLLTALYEVPLVYDEVQTGYGMTGTLWAHEQFDLPLPPDVVVWAKKAQNGVLFVSEELATFFQEEKKFNTTWEGDSVGMIRLLSLLGRLDLKQVERTGAYARAGLSAILGRHKELVSGVRGAGCMLAFDVLRSDFRDPLRERAFRRGLIMLPAGERTLRFYPRYDMEPYSLDEALELLGAALSDTEEGASRQSMSRGPERLVGTFDVPRGRLRTLPFSFADLSLVLRDVLEIEYDRYGSLPLYPPRPPRTSDRPLLLLTEATLSRAMAGARALGVLYRDGASGRPIAYALGASLEHFDEQGVLSDPHFGEGNTFYLVAMAVHPSVRNGTWLEPTILGALCDAARKAGYRYVSTLIETRIAMLDVPPLAGGEILLTLDDYLGSGQSFSYVTAPLAPAEGPGTPT